MTRPDPAHSDAAVDVLIVGGGPVGAGLGALLTNAPPVGGRPLRIAVLEPHPASAPVPGSALEPRVSALSRASERILRHAGAWQRIDTARIEPYERMRIWHESLQPASPDVLSFDAADVGEPNLGYIVENRAVQAELDCLTSRYVQRLQANLDLVARCQDEFRAWQKEKQQDSQQMTDAAAFCVPHGGAPRSASLSVVLEPARAARR